MGEKPENIKMMSLMDKHLMNHPTEGVLSIVLFLVARGYPVGPKRIRRLLRLMGREEDAEKEAGSGETAFTGPTLGHTGHS